MNMVPRAARPAYREADGTEKPEPSWFLEAANDQPRDLLAERYRRMRRLGERKHSLAAGAAGLAGKPIQPRQREARPARSRIAGTYAAMALAAMLAGGAMGYGASHPGVMTEASQALLAMFPSSGSAGPEPAAAEIAVVSATVISRKPITMAALHVADVEGEVNSLIDLPLRLEPAGPQQVLQLKIAGLPDTAYLTAGQRNAARVWTLEAKDLDGLQLMVPEMGLPRIDLAISAIEQRTGEMVTPAKTMTVALADARIEPAAAPPPSALSPKPHTPTQLSPIPSPLSTGVELPGTAAPNTMSAGDALLAAGDAEGARELYQAALDAGAAEAALGMGRSFDPLVHAQFKVNRGTADSAAAVMWYERAAQAGRAEAFQAIVRLKVKP